MPLSKRAILYSSHHLAEVEATCDVVSIIHHGKLVVDSSFGNLNQESATITVEISPHEAATTLSASHTETLDESWVRCTVDVGKKPMAIACEEIADKVNAAGGRIRLLQPVAQSLESSYLRIIRDSEAELRT